jgi:hypothetical protein
MMHRRGAFVLFGRIRRMNGLFGHLPANYVQPAYPTTTASR